MPLTRDQALGMFNTGPGGESVDMLDTFSDAQSGSLKPTESSSSSSSDGGTRRSSRLAGRRAHQEVNLMSVDDDHENGNRERRCSPKPALEFGKETGGLEIEAEGVHVWKIDNWARLIGDNQVVYSEPFVVGSHSW